LGEVSRFPSGKPLYELWGKYQGFYYPTPEKPLYEVWRKYQPLFDHLLSISQLIDKIKLKEMIIGFTKMRTIIIKE